MEFVLYLSPAASKDIIEAVNYYNSQSDGLGKRLAIETDTVLNNIAAAPKIYSFRYREIRAARIPSFPYLIYYTIDERNKLIQVLRIFNIHQKPFWKH